jgi:hypothetical protein
MTTTTMEVTTMHPKTLKEIGEGKIKAIKKPRRKATRAKIMRIKVMPEVWEVALKLAQNNVQRIEVISPEAVVVHNSSDWNNSRRLSK